MKFEDESQNVRARLRVVQIQGRNGDEARVLTGLTGNERLAIDHLGELYDGAPVRIARQIT